MATPNLHWRSAIWCLRSTIFASGRFCRKQAIEITILGIFGSCAFSHSLRPKRTRAAAVTRARPADWRHRPPQLNKRGPMLICPTGWPVIWLSSPVLQNFSLRRLVETALLIRPVPPHRGAYHDRHGRGVGCGGRGSVRRAMGSQGGFSRERSSGAQTNGACADGKVVWSWHPLLVSSWRRQVGPTGL
jgi:hypothetical protein